MNYANILSRRWDTSVKKYILNFSPKLFLFTVFVFSINWLIWIVGFAFLTYSIIGEFNLLLGAYFSFVTCVSILIVFSPVGLGVREALVAGFIYIHSSSLEYAVIISLVSRFWFFLGELIIFSCALFLLYLEKSKLMNETVMKTNATFTKYILLKLIKRS